MAEEKLVRLERCARCGEPHFDLAFKLLTRPVYSDDSDKQVYTHWAPCPINGEPVLMKVLKRNEDNYVQFSEPVFVGKIPPREDISTPPPTDRSAVTSLHGTPVDEIRKQHAAQPTGMHADYIVLTEEERKKGFVRPVRQSYQHVGIAGPKYPLRELTAEEHERYDKYYYYRYEAYPEDSGMAGRFWTQEQLDKIGRGCHMVTTMGQALAETYAREPHFYGATFCVACQKHLPVGEGGEFVWEDTSERVGT